MPRRKNRLSLAVNGSPTQDLASLARGRDPRALVAKTCDGVMLNEIARWPNISRSTL
jgi:hypothetical protein